MGSEGIESRIVSLAEQTIKAAAELNVIRNDLLRICSLLGKDPKLKLLTRKIEEDKLYFEEKEIEIEDETGLSKSYLRLEMGTERWFSLSPHFKPSLCFRSSIIYKARPSDPFVSFSLEGCRFSPFRKYEELNNFCSKYNLKIDSAKKETKLNSPKDVKRILKNKGSRNQEQKISMELKREGVYKSHVISDYEVPIRYSFQLNLSNSSTRFDLQCQLYLYGNSFVLPKQEKSMLKDFLHLFQNPE